MFDYMFYRSYIYYLPMKGENAFFNATLYTTLLQFMFISACLILINKIFFDGNIHPDKLGMSDLSWTAMFVIPGISLMIYNYIRYKKKLPKILKKYKNHFLNKHINGAVELNIFYTIILLGLLIGPFVLLKIFGFSRYWFSIH